VIKRSKRLTDNFKTNKEIFYNYFNKNLRKEEIKGKKPIIARADSVKRKAKMEQLMMEEESLQMLIKENHAKKKKL
jgi:hypothetical protein